MNYIRHCVYRMCISLYFSLWVLHCVYCTVCVVHCTIHTLWNALACALAAKQIRCQSLMLSFTTNHHLRNTDERNRGIDDWKDWGNALLEFEKYNLRNLRNIFFRTTEIHSHNLLSQIIISKFQFEYYLQVVYCYWNFTLICLTILLLF